MAANMTPSHQPVDINLGNGSTVAEEQSQIPANAAGRTVLQLAGLKLGDEDARRVASFLAVSPSLLFIDLSNNRITAEGLAAILVALQTNESLRELDIGGYELGGTDTMKRFATALANHPSLVALGFKLLKLTPSDVFALADALKVNETLYSLDLANNPLTYESVEAIADMLRANRSLARLIIRSCELTRSCVEILAGALSANSSITELDLSRNPGFDVASVAEMLKTNTTLMSLNLSNTGGGVVAIAEALLLNSTLAYLNLSFGSIGESEMSALAQSLHQNASLVELHISSNGLIPTCGVLLFEALRTNSTLRTLGVDWNKLGTSACNALAALLRVNSTLSSLDVSKNFIEFSTIEIAEALKVNASLLALDLSFNNIRSADAIALADALLVNRTLTKLNLFDRVWDEDVWFHFAAALRVNNALTNLTLSQDRSLGETAALAIANALSVNTTLVTLSLAPIPWARANEIDALFHRNGTLKDVLFGDDYTPPVVLRNCRNQFLRDLTLQQRAWLQIERNGLHPCGLPPHQNIAFARWLKDFSFSASGKNWAGLAAIERLLSDDPLPKSKSQAFHEMRRRLFAR